MSKTEVVTVRMSPRLKYIAGLAARRQRLSLSRFIEWAIKDCLPHQASKCGITIQEWREELSGLDSCQAADKALTRLSSYAGSGADRESDVAVLANAICAFNELQRELRESRE